MPRCCQGLSRARAAGARRTARRAGSGRRHQRPPSWQLGHRRRVHGPWSWWTSRSWWRIASRRGAGQWSSCRLRLPRRNGAVIRKSGTVPTIAKSSARRSPYSGHAGDPQEGGLDGAGHRRSEWVEQVDAEGLTLPWAILAASKVLGRRPAACVIAADADTRAKRREQGLITRH